MPGQNKEEEKKIKKQTWKSALVISKQMTAIPVIVAIPAEFSAQHKA